MKELLGEFADAQIKLYRDAMSDWDKVSLFPSYRMAMYVLMQ